MAEDDWDGWAMLTERWASASSSWATTCSSPISRASQQGIEHGVANAILVKVNQIGTLTETLAAMELASPPATPRSCRTARGRPRTPPSPTSRWRPAPARSRPDAPCRSDRVAKYNQLLRIEEQLGAAASYPGRSAFRA